MAHNIDYYVSCLADYGIKRGMVDPDDRIFVINRILDRLGLHSYTEPTEPTEELELEDFEIYFSSSEDMSCETYRDEISEFSSSQNTTVFFRCVKNGKLGYATTQLIDENEIIALVNRAAENSEINTGPNMTTKEEPGITMPMKQVMILL